MKLSARNVLQGKVTAMMELKLKAGDRASAIVKASDVIVGKE